MHMYRRTVEAVPVIRLCRVRMAIEAHVKRLWIRGIGFQPTGSIGASTATVGWSNWLPEGYLRVDLAQSSPWAIYHLET